LAREVAGNRDADRSTMCRVEGDGLQAEVEDLVRAELEPDEKIVATLAIAVAWGSAPRKGVAVTDRRVFFVDYTRSRHRLTVRFSPSFVSASYPRWDVRLMEYKKAVANRSFGQRDEPAQLWLSLGLETSFGETLILDIPPEYVSSAEALVDARVSNSDVFRCVHEAFSVGGHRRGS